MRITNNVMIGNMMQNLQKNMKNLDELNQQLSSGKQFRFPSEAPIQAAKSMDFNTQLENVDQFKTNVDQANSWLQTTESALNDGNKVLQRARELTIYGANDTLSQTERENLAKEVSQLREELLAITETKHGDRYVFSGQATGEKPFDRNAEYQGDNKRILREINPGVEMPVNVTGQEGFGEALEAMDHLLSDLRGGSARVYGELGPGTLAENSGGVFASGDEVSLNITIDGENFEVDQDVDGNHLTGANTRDELVAAINDMANDELGTTDEVYARVRNGNLEIRSLKEGDNRRILREINPGVEMPVNVTGQEGFGEALEAMDHLLSDLRGGSARVYGELGPGTLA
ncbi:MAG: flagellar hook-associated protein FlgL, partial [Halarsenatibacteraceae bacterium]